MEKIKNHPERIKNIKPFIDKYDWSGINFPSHKADWNLFEENNKSVALNVLHVPHNTKQIRHAYKSKYNLTLYFPMFPFDPPENIRKPLVF